MASLPPIPVPPGNSTGPSGNYFLPAYHWGNNSHMPSAWQPQPTQAFVFTPSGGQRDLSQSHPFIQVTVEYHGNRTGVDLEGTDGISDITCGPDYWKIQTKDAEHFQFAKSWNRDNILVTTTWCQSGSSRRLIQVSNVTYLPPDTIMVYGQESLFGLGSPVSKMRTSFGTHRPDLSKRNLYKPQPDTNLKWKRAHQNPKRDIFGDAGSFFGGLGSTITSDAGDAASSITSDGGDVASSITSDGGDVASSITSDGGDLASTITSGAMGAESTLTSGAVGAESTLTSGAVGVESTLTSGAVGLESTVTSAADSIYTVVTSDAKSVFTMVTGDIGKLLQQNISKTMSTTVQIPKSAPTQISPWGNYGEKLFTFNNMDFWNLGVQLAGSIEMEGDIEIYAEKVGTDAFIKGHLGLTGSAWKLDFPVGVVFRNAEFNAQWQRYQLMEPLSLCPEFGCFAVENIFELGSFVQLVLNITLNVNATGKITMGSNNSYADPTAIWSFGGDHSHNVSGWQGVHKKWFNASDGIGSVEGSLGVDLQQYNGLNFPMLPMGQVGASIANGVSIVAHVKSGVKGNDHQRRDMSKREHAKDILARELAKRDTCVEDGGIDVILDLQEQVVIQAGLGPLTKDIPLWATQIPLTSTCLEGMGHVVNTSTLFPNGTGGPGVLHSEWRNLTHISGLPSGSLPFNPGYIPGGLPYGRGPKSTSASTTGSGKGTETSPGSDPTGTHGHHGKHDARVRI
ncbi:MAG: hypothetical protein M1821_006787 [Bathelium mastoideum]|nr:MAG: hypothetical protein M1821_006787 [Bathelium mastoideum]